MSKKLISTFIATIILVALTVGIGVMIYFYFSGYLSQTQSQIEELPIKSMIECSKANVDIFGKVSWLSGWQYRKPITIQENSGNTLIDYQVLITLDTASLISAGKMRSDCGDIRFTDSDGITLLNYWIESGCNSANTKIWVKVPNIPASLTKAIYVYYGNPSATSLSNGDLVFYFFDDFEETSLDTSKWYISSGTSYTLSNGILKITTGAIGLQNDLPFNINNGYMVEGKIQYNSNSEYGYSGVLETSSSRFTASGNANADATVLYMVEVGNGNNTVSTWIGNGDTNSYNIANASTVFTMTLNTWYILGIEATSSTVGLWKDYSRLLGYSVSWAKNMRYVSLGAFHGDGNYDIKDTSYDWIRIRKYISPEPSVTIGNEEILNAIRLTLTNFGINLGKKFNVKLEYEDGNIVFRNITLNKIFETGETIEQILFGLPKGTIKKITIYSLDVCPNIIVGIKNVNIEI